MSHFIFRGWRLVKRHCHRPELIWQLHYHLVASAESCIRSLMWPLLCIFLKAGCSECVEQALPTARSSLEQMIALTLLLATGPLPRAFAVPITNSFVSFLGHFLKVDSSACFSYPFPYLLPLLPVLEVGLILLLSYSSHDFLKEQN